MSTHTTIPFEGDEHDKRAMRILAVEEGYRTLGQFTRAAVEKAFGERLEPLAQKFRESGDIILHSGDTAS